MKTSKFDKIFNIIMEEVSSSMDEFEKNCLLCYTKDNYPVVIVGQELINQKPKDVFTSTDKDPEEIIEALCGNKTWEEYLKQKEFDVLEFQNKKTNHEIQLMKRRQQSHNKWAREHGYKEHFKDFDDINWFCLNEKYKFTQYSVDGQKFMVLQDRNKYSIPAYVAAPFRSSYDNHAEDCLWNPDLN